MRKNNINMKNLPLLVKFFSRCGAIAALCLATASHAGLLDLPNTQELPEYEEGTMVLDLDVPSVRERDPDPQAGPRLNVREFRVQGVVEYPERGISRDEIIRRVEGLRFEMMQEGELLDTGYTLDELSEVSDLIGEIEDETKDEHVGPVEVQRLVFLIREQRRKRGITLGMIEQVADTITRYYRENGFILAKAYIPQQEVRDGIVTLTLLLGELGEVEVQNQKRYRASILQRTFNSAMSEPVASADIEERLYLVNDLPGLSARGYFQPGSQVGDTKLNVNVLSEDWFDANIRVDNHGSKGAGENRFYADFSLHNPLRIADQLQLSVLSSSDGESSLFGSVRYSSNIISPRTNVYLGVSTNQFALDQTFGSSEGGGVNVTGDSLVKDLGITYKIRRSRVTNHSVDFKVSDIFTSFVVSTGSEGESSQSQAPTENELQNVSLNYNFDILRERQRTLHSARIGLTYTSVKLDSSAGQLGGSDPEDPGEQILSFDYSRLAFWKLPLIGSETRLVARSSGQYTPAYLLSANQFSLAGPTRARGFEVNKFYADNALYVGVDWMFNGPGGSVTLGNKKLSDIIQPYVFVDGAWGYQYTKVVDGEDSVIAKLADAGLGLQLRYGSFRANFIAATPLLSENNAEGLADSDAASGDESTSTKKSKDDEGVNFFIDMQYSF
jgi:Hemolysin activation/secretion protein|nr:ShlB/FhaC/HecB family hemolysin secretion/activation protein [Teredinibacter waterburyi]